jgi:dTDP-glucose 4,6-dehydratase/UDP-glucuronate decarboxylase
MRRARVLTAEFGALSGGPAAGDSWSTTSCNPSCIRTRRTRRGAKINFTVYDNNARGVPEWLEALRDRPHLQLRRQDRAT